MIRRLILPLLMVPLALRALPALASGLPVPPVPPDHPPLLDQAPVPDVQVEAPVRLTQQEMSLDVRLYRARMYDPSMGFAPGSRYESSEDRKSIQTPGFSVTVPLK